MVAEVTAREIGRISLLEALDLTALIALKDPRRKSRVGVRWLQRLLEEHPLVTLEEAALAAASLQALGGPAHEDAYQALAGMAEQATSEHRRPRVAS